LAGNANAVAEHRTSEPEVAGIMARYNRRLFRVAWSILRDEAAAEDAVQETYIQYFRKRNSFRGDSDLGTWLTRIAINQALMQKRRGRPTVALEELVPSADVLLHPALVNSDDPEKLAARRELRLLIEDAVAELPEAFRLAFVLREVEGLDTEEAAAILGVGTETVRSRLHRAKKRLRARLDKEFASLLDESFPFAGARCAALVRRVMTRLRAEGIVSQV